MSEHAGQGGAKFFRMAKPLRLVYLERGHTRSSASRREAEIKKLRRIEKCRLIETEMNEITETKR